MSSRQKTLQDLGLNQSDATRLENILTADEKGITRSKQDQEFVNQCRLNILKKG